MGSDHRTYVVSVREGPGATTVEEVRTGRKARLGTLGDAIAQIELWMREAKPDGRADRRDGP
jgi:hypothetical protein